MIGLDVRLYTPILNCPIACHIHLMMFLSKVGFCVSSLTFAIIHFLCHQCILRFPTAFFGSQYPLFTTTNHLFSYPVLNFKFKICFKCF